MKNICIIPARGGSKRIPFKNIKDFNGVPIIEYAIKTAIESDLFDTIVVSTDYGEIEAIAWSYDKVRIHKRSAKTASDTATTVDVIQEVLGMTKTEFDSFCCLYPCTPLLTTARLKEGHDLLYGLEDYDSVMSVIRYGHPIQRAWGLYDEDRCIMPLCKADQIATTQSMPPFFYDAGQFYWSHVNTFDDELPHGRVGYVEIPESECQDLDNEEDWKLAEIKYEYMLKNKKF